MITLSDISVVIGGKKLAHPLMNASGILGSEPEHVDILVQAGFSAVVTKTFTMQQREGYKPPILIDLGHIGFINAVGLSNPGIRGIRNIVKRARELSVPIIVSIAGSTVDEFIKLSMEAEDSGADMIELNLSCPHVEKHGIELGMDPLYVKQVVKEIASVVKIPVIAKLGLCDKIVDSAGKALESGAKALTLINTIRAITIDPYSLKPVLTNKYGGLSGPAIKPISVRVVYDVYKEYRADIIGCGGIQDWRDVAEFLLAGAKAVQIGSGYLKNKTIVSEILQGLNNWIKLHGFKTILESVGYAHRD